MIHCSQKDIVFGHIMNMHQHSMDMHAYAEHEQCYWKMSGLTCLSVCLSCSL